MTDQGESNWPPPWRLSAPESHVLEHRGGANSDIPFRLAVEEMAARGVLTAHRVERSWLRDPTPKAYALTDGPHMGSELPVVLQPALTAYQATPRRATRSLHDGSKLIGVRLRDLVKTARKQLGGLERYLDDHVRATLVEQGLIEPAGRRGMASRPDFEWTAAGREADQILQWWLDLGRANLYRWVSDDPVGGARFVSEAGSALLLLDGFGSDIVQLGRRLESVAAAADGPPPDTDLDLTRIAELAIGIGEVNGISEPARPAAGFDSGGVGVSG